LFFTQIQAAYSVQKYVLDASQRCTVSAFDGFLWGSNRFGLYHSYCLSYTLFADQEMVQQRWFTAQVSLLLDLLSLAQVDYKYSHQPCWRCPGILRE